MGNVKPGSKYETPTLSRWTWFKLLVDEHPFELSMSLALILFGMSALFTGFGTLPPSVYYLHSSFIYSYVILSLVSGVTIAFGLLARWRYTWAYGLEAFGLYVASSAWGCYSVGLLLTRFNLQGWLIISAILSLAVACLVRAMYLNKRSRSILDALRMELSKQGSADADDG